MRIYIPTRNRFSKQATLHNLPKSLIRDVVLVVNWSERKAYRKLYKDKVEILVCPRHMEYLNAVRQFICDQHDITKYGKRLMMLDDDLIFSVRREDDPTRFLSARGKVLKKGFDQWMELSKRYAHCGLLARNGANHRVTEKIRECTRIYCNIILNVAVMRKHNVRYTRLPTIEDFDVALQLLRLGYKNAAMCSYVCCGHSSNTPGGCSDYRTIRLQKEAAIGLATLHPGFVRVVRKHTKFSWQGKPRYDVTIQWKKAYASSQVNR